MGTFGDVVISTAVLPALQEKFPGCQIDFLTSSRSSVVVQNHPAISQVHQFDHFWISPVSSRCKAVLHHLRTRSTVLQELKQMSYDLAIDLYPYFPNAIPLLAQTTIPTLIGYPTGGFRKLLTHCVEWHFSDCYMGYAHLHLLQYLQIDITKYSGLPDYCYKSASSEYIVIHMGSLQSNKEWAPQKWTALISRLERNGFKVLLTGKGSRESHICAQVAGKTQALNLSDQLDWNQFVKTVQEARLFITVDSVGVHLTAASKTPTVELLTGMNVANMWVPPSPTHITLSCDLPCNPCLQKQGCTRMHCIQDITVEMVYEAARSLL
jgi:heptosyltransferase-3